MDIIIVLCVEHTVHSVLCNNIYLQHLTRPSVQPLISVHQDLRQTVNLMTAKLSILVKEVIKCINNWSLLLPCIYVTECSSEEDKIFDLQAGLGFFVAFLSVVLLVVIGILIFSCVVCIKAN